MQLELTSEHEKGLLAGYADDLMAGDGDIASGAEFCIKATDQTTSRFFAGIQKTKVERIAVGM